MFKCQNNEMKPKAMSKKVRRIVESTSSRARSEHDKIHLTFSELGKNYANATNEFYLYSEVYP